MKHVLIALLALICTHAFCQFHVKVMPNPMNRGEVNSEWANNYVIAYTCNDWGNTHYIQYQATYSGFDDNGRTYYSSQYENITFQKLNDALELAKRFDSPKQVGLYEAQQYSKHAQLKSEYDKAAKLLCFGCKKNETAKGKEVNIY